MKKIIEKIVKVVKHYPELLSIPIALIAWKLSVYVLRWLDPTSGIYDAGIFQIPLFAIIQFFLFISIAWLAMHLFYSTLRDYLQYDFKTEFAKLDVWQKVRLAFCVFFGLFFGLAYLANTLMTK